MHYEIAREEGEAEWQTFFEHLIERGLQADAVELVVSDGCLGLPKALRSKLSKAQQQRCTTHKVRGLERYLSYQQPIPNYTRVIFLPKMVTCSL